MSKLVFTGNIAKLKLGIDKRIGNVALTLDPHNTGNQNSEYDYTLFCQCTVELGPLGRFRPNADGIRTVLCPECDSMTIITKNGQIAKVVKIKKLEDQPIITPITPTIISK